jgi:hypothetical protein
MRWTTSLVGWCGDGSVLDRPTGGLVGEPTTRNRPMGPISATRTNPPDMSHPRASSVDEILSRLEAGLHCHSEGREAATPPDVTPAPPGDSLQTGLGEPR